MNQCSDTGCQCCKCWLSPLHHSARCYSNFLDGEVHKNTLIAKGRAQDNNSSPQPQPTVHQRPSALHCHFHLIQQLGFEKEKHTPWLRDGIRPLKAPKAPGRGDGSCALFGSDRPQLPAQGGTHCSLPPSLIPGGHPCPSSQLQIHGLSIRTPCAGATWALRTLISHRRTRDKVPNRSPHAYNSLDQA